MIDDRCKLSIKNLADLANSAVFFKLYLLNLREINNFSLTEITQMSCWNLLTNR